MQVKIKKKQIQLFANMAESFSSQVKNGDALDRSVKFSAENGDLVITSHVHSVNSGFSLTVSHDEVDYEVLEDGHVTIFSSWFKAGVDSIISDYIVIESSNNKVVIYSESDDSQKVELDIPIESDQQNWDLPPSNEQDEYCVVDLNLFVDVLTDSSPSGIPLVSSAVVVHPDDSSILVSTGQINGYFISFYRLETEENTLNDNLLIHSDFISVAMKSLKSLSLENAKLRVAHDKDLKAVVYILEKDGVDYAYMWSPTASQQGSGSLNFDQFLAGANKSISESSEMVSIGRAELVDAAKYSLKVGQVAGALRDKLGNVDRTGPVKFYCTDDLAVIQSLQESSVYTRELTLDSSIENEVSLRMPFNLMEPFFKSSVFSGPTLNLLVTRFSEGSTILTLTATADTTKSDILNQSVIFICGNI